MNRSSGNLSGGERAFSAISGVALSIFGASRGGPILRVLASTAGAALLARAFAGHCAMKAALSGESTLREGALEQWRQTSRTGRNLAATARRKVATAGEALEEQIGEPIARQARASSLADGPVTGSF